MKMKKLIAIVLACILGLSLVPVTSRTVYAVQSNELASGTVFKVGDDMNLGDEYTINGHEFEIAIYTLTQATKNDDNTFTPVTTGGRYYFVYNGDVWIDLGLDATDISDGVEVSKNGDTYSFIFMKFLSLLQPTTSSQFRPLCR